MVVALGVEMDRLYVLYPSRARLGHRHRTHIEVLLLLLLSQTEHVRIGLKNVSSVEKAEAFRVIRDQTLE